MFKEFKLLISKLGKFKNKKIGKPYSEGFLKPKKNNCISVFACLNAKSSLIPVENKAQTPS